MRLKRLYSGLLALGLSCSVLFQTLTNSDDYPEFKVVKTGKTQRLEEVFTV